MSAEPGPPPFVLDEVVRVVAFDPDAEFDDFEDFGTTLYEVVGRELVVVAALARSDESGWRMRLWDPAAPSDVVSPYWTIDMDVLTTTELAYVYRTDEREPDRALLDRDARPWRDDVMVCFGLSVDDRDTAQALAERVVTELHRLVPDSIVRTRIDRPYIDGDHWDSTLWIEPRGDLLATFAAVLGAMPDAADAADDDDQFLGARWECDRRGTFLGAEVLELSVCCRRWTTPLRPTRAELDAVSR